MNYRQLLLTLLACTLSSFQANAKPESIYYEDIKPIVVWALEYKTVKEAHNGFNLAQNTREYSEFTEKCRTPLNNFLNMVPSKFGTSVFDDPDSIPSSAEAPMIFFSGLGVNPVNQKTIGELVSTCDKYVKDLISIQDSTQARIDQKKAEKLEKLHQESEKRKQAAFEVKLSEHTSLVVESLTCLELMKKDQSEKEEWFEKVRTIAEQHHFSNVYVNGMGSYIDHLKETSDSPIERTLIRMSPRDDFKSFDQIKDIVFYSNDNSEIVLAARQKEQVVMGSRLNVQWVAFLELGNYETILRTRKQYFLIEKVDGERLGLPNISATESTFCAINNEKLEEAVSFIKNSGKEDVLIRKLNESFDHHGLPRARL